MLRAVRGVAARACSSSCIILGGILSGVFTATESAAIAVIYALLLTIVVYRIAVVGELPQGGRQGGARPPASCCC